MFTQKYFHVYFFLISDMDYKKDINSEEKQVNIMLWKDRNATMEIGKKLMIEQLQKEIENNWQDKKLCKIYL